MPKKICILLSFLLSLFVVQACASPAGTGAPAGTDNVEKVVALTFQALTAQAPQVTVTPQLPSLLPHPLYFLNKDSGGLVQVYRLERDGQTLKQLTFEPSNVEGYDVSPVDGNVVYVSNNQLLNINADGSSRSMLVDGGAVAADDFLGRLKKTVRTPRWSKDGQAIVFCLNGLSFYSIKDGVVTTALETKLIGSNPNTVSSYESYFPEAYSPDGSKILIQIAYLETTNLAIYVPATGALYKLTRPDGGLVAGTTYWSPDGNSVYVASSTMGMIDSGLWRFNAADGVGVTLIPTKNPDGSINYAESPFIAPDGQLYYFFNSLSDYSSDHTPLQLVRSGVDGVTRRTVLRTETYTLINPALWSPDGTFAILTYPTLGQNIDGGRAEIVYVDGNANVVLAPFAMDLRWGP